VPQPLKDRRSRRLQTSHGAFSRQEDIIGSSEDPRFECPNGVQG
jgi:hypothetical protein